MKLPLLAAILAATSALAPAALIFQNGEPNQSSGNSRIISFFRFADDFTLGAASDVEAVRFWMVAPSQSFAGTLSYAFYQNSNGTPGALITSGSVSNVTPLFLSNVPNLIQNTYQVDFNLPALLNLAAGSYWLELHDGAALNTSTNSQVGWAVAATGPGNARLGSLASVPNSPITDDLAFSLYGNVSTAPPPTGVPEPSAIALSLAGLAAIGALRLRNRRQ